MKVELRPVRRPEYDAFFALMDPYHRELAPYDPLGDPLDPAQYRAAMLDDMEGRELRWIVADGERAGFAMVRVLPDFPDERSDVAEIIEFYVLPEHRRRGVGRAAVEALLAEHRRRGTALVEAGILRDNAPARAFWASLGFEVRSLHTARRP